ncbi:MAG: hypothetical protein DRM99_00150 [Thermoplasmata archaeon]|nr:MAG: hypothetical protein DRM99_00150 [Thermoplasmata archaeon]
MLKKKNKRNIKTNIVIIFIILFLLNISIINASNIKTNSKNTRWGKEQNDSDKKLIEIKKAIEEKHARWVADYTSAVDKYSDMFTKGLGCRIEKKDEKEYEKVTYDGSVPSSWDWRDVNGTDWTTSIKDQGQCGSCVAFGVIGALEPLVQISVGKPFGCDLSEADLFFCGGGRCSMGWSLDEAANFLKSTGVTDEACFPYNDYDMSCDEKNNNWIGRTVKISRSAFITPSIPVIKDALLRYGPLVTSMKVYVDFLYYSGGIYTRVSDDFVGWHAVTIVGYNDTGEYWVCKNSWGTGWGENGWFKIGYHECEIEDDTMYMSGVHGNIQPFPPENPEPSNYENNINIDVTLSWICEGDPDGDNVYYNVYLSDSPGSSFTENDLLAYHSSSTSLHVTDLKKNQFYHWQVVVEDIHGSQYIGPTWCFRTIEGHPPKTPSLYGPKKIKQGVEYEYLITTTDPDDDQVYYFIDWDDGNVENWIGPYNSGENVKITHKWNNRGKYTIKIRAKDVYNTYSEWGSFDVTMPRGRQLYNPSQYNPIILFQKIKQIWSFLYLF